VDVVGKAVGAGNLVPERTSQTRVSAHVNPAGKIDPPQHFRAPEIFEEASLQGELSGCLNELQSIFGSSSPLSASVVKELRTLNARMLSRADSVLYDAALDLWDVYSVRGDDTFLPLAARVAWYIFCSGVVRKLDQVRRSKALNLWMKTQLRDLMVACDLPELLQDADRLCISLGCFRNLGWMWQTVIEAHAGEFRRLDRQGDVAGMKRLAELNGDALKSALKEHERRQGRANEEETRAWDDVSEHLQSLLPDPELDRGSHSGAAGSKLLANQEFQQVIKSGNHEDANHFIESHLEEIQAALRDRLGVRMSPEFVMLPDGTVFDAIADRSNTPAPAFVDAKDSLKRGDFKRASSLFGRLATRIQDKNKQICRNYLAYALAKQDELLEARGHLRELSKARFPYISAHWNLACCTTEMDQQLEVLAVGLECAPHPQILHAAVYLAVLLNQGDKRLRQWLRWLPMLEALLLLFHLEFDETTAEQRDNTLLRISRYVRDGELHIPDPMANTAGRDVDEFIDTLIDRHQEEAVEFWLRCREVEHRGRFEFWRLKVDFLERIDRRPDAVAAFKKEIEYRLRYLGRGDTKAINPYILSTTRARLEKWLSQCMNPNLRNDGLDIYSRVASFERNSGLGLLPRTNRVHDYYDPKASSGATGAAGGPTGGGLTGSSASGVTAQPHQVQADLERLIPSLAAVAQAQLHDASHLPPLLPQFEGLKHALRKRGAEKSAIALDRLLQEWTARRQDQGAHERQNLLQAARAAQAELQGHVQQELPASLSMLAEPLLKTFRRVNDRLAKLLDLLPDISVAALPEAPPFIDPEAEVTAFVTRVRSAPGGAAVRLLGAIATLDDGITVFPLQDSLDAPRVTVDPQQPAVLTFGTPRGFRLDRPRSARIELSYEYEGARYNAKPSQTELVPKECPQLPTISPYIFHRPLELDEIERHFFGRDQEQEEILQHVGKGQQRVIYVEGIRRAGKSSLLHSLEYEIVKRHLPLVPVYLKGGSFAAHEQAGRILYNLLNTVSQHPAIIEAGLTPPDEQRCCDNLPDAYAQFQRALGERLPDRRVLVMLDDFQALIEAAARAKDTNPLLHRGVMGLLDTIRDYATPTARLLWLFAGHRAYRQYRQLLPGVLLWANIQPLPIDFLGESAVGKILTAPLANTSMIAPAETVVCLHRLTAGHPEVVQELAERMLKHARQERRQVLTPADAAFAAQELAHAKDFSDSWYPLEELSEPQRKLMADFANALPIGGRIEPHKLVPNNRYTDALKREVDDLIARKILDSRVDTTVGVKAHVLDLWLHQELPKLPTEGFTGSAAVFIDIANLTGGTGETTLRGLQTAAGEGVAGKFSLTTVLDRIEEYTQRLTPAPIAERWAVNFPKACPAVMELNNRDFKIANIPEDYRQKGQDDLILMSAISEVTQDRPAVKHFVLVLGDGDYRVVTVEQLMKSGKVVHIISPARSLKPLYQQLASRYPESCKVVRLEDLLSQPARS
jgi:hypothetical protein